MSRQGKRRERTVKNVKDFWNKEALDWGDNPRVTIRDHYFRLLEIETVTSFIKNRKRVLDIGCGTGFSSMFYAEEVGTLVGVDYAELMVEKARRFLTDKKYFDKVMKRYAIDGKPQLRGNLLFEEGNILDINYPDGFFDAVVGERVLINLPKESLQEEAVEELFRVLRKKGILVLVEVTKQGHESVDKVRKLFGLGGIEKYWHNLYLNEPRFEKKLRNSKFYIKKKIYFETYQFLTKVFHPFMVKPKEPKFMAKFNNVARIIAKKFPTYKDVSKIGIQKFLNNHVRHLLLESDPPIVRKYDKAVLKAIKINPNFSGCSHQVLYFLEKR